MRDIFFIVFFIFLLFLSCKNRNVEMEAEAEIIPLAIPSDTVLFKYVLGESKTKTDIHTNELIKSKTIKPSTTKYLSMSLAGQKVNFTESGYPCVVFMGEYSIPSLMKLFFYKDTLLRQRFYMYGESPSYSELEKLYGNSKTNEYPIEGDRDKTTFWSIGDKAIYTSGYLGHYVLNFEKMSSKIRMERDIKDEDIARRTKMKESNREQSKEMGW